MASAVFSLAAAKLLSGTISMSGDNIKASIVDLSDDGVAITNATNATPIVITSTSHGLTSGDKVFIVNVGGNTSANGVRLVTVTDANTYSLQDLSGANVAGSGAYTSGGTGLSMEVIEFFDDFTGVVASSANLASKTVLRGIFDAANLTINSVSGDEVDVILIWKDTGTPSTSSAIALVTGSATPDGNNVNITWEASGIFAIA
jgi:hypothetical protein